MLETAGFSLPRGPRRALLSLILRRLWIRLRGLKFVERDASEISEAELFRIDICWAIAAGLGAVDFICVKFVVLRRSADSACPLGTRHRGPGRAGGGEHGGRTQLRVRHGCALAGYRLCQWSSDIQGACSSAIRRVA